MSSIRGDPLANTGPCHADLRRILLQFQQQKTRLADWRAFWVSSSQLLALRERGLAQTKFLRCLPTSAILWLRFFDLHQVLSSDLGKSQRQRITHGYVSCRCCTSGNSLTSLDLLMTHAGEGRVKPTVLLHCLLFPYLCYTHYTEWNQSVPTEEWVPGLLVTRYVIVLLLTLTSHYYHCLWFLHSCSSQHSPGCSAPCKEGSSWGFPITDKDCTKCCIQLRVSCVWSLQMDRKTKKHAFLLIRELYTK